MSDWTLFVAIATSVVTAVFGVLSITRDVGKFLTISQVSVVAFGGYLTVMSLRKGPCEGMGDYWMVLAFQISMLILFDHLSHKKV